MRLQAPPDDLQLAERRELALLRRALQVLDPAHPEHDPFQALMNAVQELLEVEHVGIGLIEGDRLVVREVAGGGGWQRDYPLNGGLSGQVARTGEAVLVPDVLRHPAYTRVHPGVVSEICVPLLDGEQVVGVLNVESEGRRLGEADLRPLLALSTWLGRALERGRLYEASERQRTALKLLHDLRSLLGEADDAPAAIRAVTAGVSQAFGYSHVSVYLLDAEVLTLQHQVGYEHVITHLPVTRGVMGRAALSGTRQWEPDLRQDAEAVMAVDAVTSEVCVPLLVEGTVAGVLNVETVGEGRRLTAWDAELLGTVGSHLQQVLERLRLREQARERDLMFQLIAEHTGDLVCLHAPDGRLRYVSPSAQALLGQAPPALLGRHPRSLTHPEDWPTLRGARPGEGATVLRFRTHPATGAVRWLETTLGSVPGLAEGHFVSSTRDVTAQQVAQDALGWAAHHDALTGLANRAALKGALETQAATGRPFGVLFLDLDGFKAVNDSLGHAAGDRLLVAVAGRLSGALHPRELLARLGGDEFCVLLPDVGEAATASARAGELRATLAAPFTVAGQALFLTASVGVSVGQGDGPALLRQADLAMYAAKRAGKNAVRPFHRAMPGAAHERLMLEQQLRGALERQELAIHVQPQFELAGGRLRGVEALLRWTPPGGPPVSPAVFIPAAEDLGMIVPIGAWVLDQSCALLAARPELPLVAVNVSPLQVADPQFLDTVISALGRHRVAPERLELEVTERIVIADMAATEALFGQLRAHGLRLALDDFGAGVASLHQLLGLPFDTLKFDRSLIASLDVRPSAPRVLGALRALAHDLGLSVIAEGIETAAQRDAVRALGCDAAQGYFLGRPGPPETVPAPGERRPGGRRAARPTL